LPSHLATCLRVLQRASGPPVELNLPSGPRERLAALARSNVPGECVMTARLLAIWAELGQWRRSAAQKASAIECWSRASALANVSPWPPAEGGFAVFALVCKSDRRVRPRLDATPLPVSCPLRSLQKYCSYLRAVLRLLRCQLGVLGDTSGVVRGAEKANLGGASSKFKARATASQAGQPPCCLCAHSRRMSRGPARCRSWPSGQSASGGQTWLTPTWWPGEPCWLDRARFAPPPLRGRQFCLRFGAEVVGLNARGHSRVFTADEVRAAVCGCADALRRTRRTPAGWPGSSSWHANASSALSSCGESASAAYRVSACVAYVSCIGDSPQRDHESFPT
jgi:hypothetical protein